MLQPKVYRCAKCKRPFIAWCGGIIMSKEKIELETHPLCEKCRRQRSVFGVKREKENIPDK